MELLFTSTEDLPFVIIGEYGEYHLRFHAYLVCRDSQPDVLDCIADPSCGGKPKYTIRQLIENTPEVGKDTEAEVAGHIKWDGCANLHFGDDGYLHLCGLDHVQRLLNIVAVAYELAKSIESWDGD